MTADMLGASSDNVLLVGIAGKCYEPGQSLSAAVRQSVAQAIDAILLELQRLSHTFEKKLKANKPSIWWNDHHSSIPIETQGQR
jgi:hypothetical protein